MTLGNIMNTSTLTATFDDEFNSFSASPDGSSGLWQTTVGNNNRTLGSNGEEEYYSDSSVGTNPFSIQNGVLDISASPGSNALGLPYNSGAINTQHSFSQLYGYFEIDAKLPAGQGLWPAFWLLPASGAWPPELDVFEVLGNDPSTLYFSTHSTVQATQGTTLSVANVSAGFNLYGVMWGPNTVDLYINNVEVASMPTPADMNVPMYMLANLAVGGYWPGDPDSSTQFPANMLIDYVRAYAYPGTTGGTVTDSAPSPGSSDVSVAPVTSTSSTAVSDPSPASVTDPVPASTVDPVVTTPGSFALTAKTTASLSGLRVADGSASGDVTVLISDSSGLLVSTATSGVTESGEGSRSLTLTGSVDAVNAALGTVTYAAGAAGTDWLWVSAALPNGPQGLGHVVVTAAAAPSAPVPDQAADGVPVVTAPAGLAVLGGETKALGGVSVADGTSSGALTVMVSDSTGLLTSGAASGVTARGEGSTALALTGDAAAINAALASLTYTAKAGAGTDWLWVSANPVNATTGPVAVRPVVVTTSDTVNLTGVMLGVSDAATFVTATLTDSKGLLATAASQGVTVSGENGTHLELKGLAAAVSDELASLTYTMGGGGAITGSTDSLHVVIAGAAGNQLSSMVLPLISGHLSS
jgi:beta-glucanase (GH16 family)